MMAQFGHCPFAIRYKLFKTYCNNFYGCQLWKLNDCTMEKLFTAWRKCVRVVCKIHNMTHKALLPHIIDDHMLDFQLHKNSRNFMNSCLRSKNVIVRQCAQISTYNYPCLLNHNMMFLRGRYNVQLMYNNYIPVIHQCFSSEDDIRIGRTIRELIIFSENCDREDRDNLKDIIKHLCIS